MEVSDNDILLRSFFAGKISVLLMVFVLLCISWCACLLKVEGLRGCLSACDSAEATKILSCHISLHLLEQKESRLSGWFVVPVNPPHTLETRLEKNLKTLLFLSLIHKPKPQRVLFSPPVLYVKQFKWCNLQGRFLYLFFLSFSCFCWPLFPPLNLKFLVKEIEGVIPS